MRAYPVNSPKAAVRIVALAAIADGHICKSELDVLDKLNAPMLLGLERAEIHAVIHTLCEDLLASAAHTCWSDACRVDDVTLGELLSEIESPELRTTVMQLCVSVVGADEHVAEGETAIMAKAVTHWGIPIASLAPITPQRATT